jgi:DNA-binding MarR family transcriptional regulator
MPNRRQAVNGLPDRAWNLLRHGDPENRYDGDGSRLVGAVVLLAVNSGANREWVRSLLADPQHPGGFAALRRRRDVDRWYGREWSRALAKVRESPPVTGRHDATMRAAELAEHAMSLGWRGVGGATDLAVYGFALGVAARAGRLSPLALASRAVAEGVGITHPTATRSLGRLVDRKLLRRVENGAGRFAAQFAVADERSSVTGACATAPQGGVRNCTTGSGQEPPSENFADNPDEVDVRYRTTGSSEGPTCAPAPQGADNPDEVDVRYCTTRVTHSSSSSCGGVVQLRTSETWRWGGLGLSKYRTWSALDTVESTTAGELAEHHGTTAGTIRRHLAALVEHGLAERLEGEYRRTDRDPQDLADELGVAGMAERQRRQHELESKLHAAARAAYATCSIGAPAVDPETGEIANHRTPPDPPDQPDPPEPEPAPAPDADQAVDLLKAAFPGAVEVQPTAAEILKHPTPQESAGREGSTAVDPSVSQPMYLDSDEWRRADNGVLAHRCETCRATMTCRRHGDRWTCSRCRPAVAS